MERKKGGKRNENFRVLLSKRRNKAKFPFLHLLFPYCHEKESWNKVTKGKR
jgi:hypothetical protein